MPARGRKIMTKNYSWRVIDIVTAAVLGVACGLLFWVWNSIGYAGYKALDTLTPGLAAWLWVSGSSAACLVA